MRLKSLKNDKILPFIFKSNFKRCLALGMAFFLGIGGGAFAVGCLSNVQFCELENYLHGFLQLAGKESFNSSELFFISLKNNTRLVFLLWLAGITVIGIPFIYLMIAARGFVTGFSSGLFIKSLGIKGSFFAMASIIPGELIMVPCYIILAANGLFFSFNIVKSRSLRDPPLHNIKRELIGYCLLTVFFEVIIVAGCFVDAYIPPLLMRVLLPSVSGN